jgi:phospholipase/lecithinase/hemolysin
VEDVERPLTTGSEAVRPSSVSQIGIAITAVFLSLSSTAASAQSYSGIYIFGDSLVDSGNARDAAITINSLPPPFPDVPDPSPPSLGYFDGRFSNGYNFADLLSLAYTGVEPSTTFPYGFPSPLGPIPITQPIGSSLNFAYGGARAIQGPEPVPSLALQVDAYASLRGVADPNALYVITIGGNDLRGLVPSTGLTSPDSLGDAYLGSVASLVAGQTSRLLSLGANNILVTGAPDIGLLPRYLGTADEAARRAAGTDFSMTLDNLLQSQLKQISLQPDDRLTFYSLRDFTNNVLANPSAYGFTNVSQPCLALRTPSPNINCNGFVFFDDIHPTAQVHGLVANSILSTLAGTSVPEPSTWAMMLLGFGFVGGALRSARRRQKITVSYA